MDIPMYLQKYNKIIVSGCQRSGTTVVSKMLAADLGYPHVDEVDYGTYRFDSFLERLKSMDKVVIHCPALAHQLTNISKELDHSTDHPLSGMVVIWVLRPFEEIRASIKRIGWDAEEPKEIAKYASFAEEYGLSLDCGIEELKFKAWQIQKTLLNGIDSLEIEYHSPYVKQHRLFIEDNKRVNFGPKQTEI